MKKLFSFAQLLLLSFCLISINQVMADTAPAGNDSSIVNQIKAKYDASGLIDSSDVQVSSQNGNVALSGVVKNKRQYENAVALAVSADGVQGVNADALRVKRSNASLKDEYVTGKLKGLLLKQQYISQSNGKFSGIKVKAENGVVDVSGQVNTSAQKDAILAIVQSVEGVESVKDNISIKQ